MVKTAIGMTKRGNMWAWSIRTVGGTRLFGLVDSRQAAFETIFVIMKYSA